MRRISLLLLLSSLLVLGCPSGSDDDTTVDDDVRFDPAPVVVVVLVDTVGDAYLGHRHEAWDVTPNVDGLLAESTVLENTLTVRGLTSVAVSSILTGVYPRRHFVRNNANRKRPSQPLLAERFDDAGYATYGYAANVCQFIDDGIDDRYCTWAVEQPDPSMELRVRDEMLVERLLGQLADRPPDEPTFVWLHLMHPHKPYSRVDPWYGEFHPEPYEGELGDKLDTALDLAALGDKALDEADMDHVRAVYASQIRETDRLLGELFDGLDELGLWEDAVVVFGADHGEEVGEHHDYFWHSCSPYLPVNRVLFSIRAPDRVPAGQVLTGWASVTDIAPTLVQAAGLDWTGEEDGISLVDEMRSGALPTRPVFLERGEEAAGVVADGHLYIRDEDGGYGDCMPYNQSTEHLFPGELDELYDLTADPTQHDDLAAVETETLQGLRTVLCDWVNSDPWMQNPDANERNSLVQSCRELGSDGDAGDDEPDGGEGGGDGGGCASAAGRAPAGGPAMTVLMTGCVLALLGLIRRKGKV